MTTTTHQDQVINHLRKAEKTAATEVHTLSRLKRSGPLDEQKHDYIWELKKKAELILVMAKQQVQMLEEL